MENSTWNEGLDSVESEPPVSVSSAMQTAFGLVHRIADTDVPVLILGESGTGKEVVARMIHSKSRRRPKPWVKVNCAALPGELLESELFGHDRGAFTGALVDKPGKFELADTGTLFLDEIGELAGRLQAKLLQVLQDEEFFRVGGKKNIRVDTRVVVATHRDLKKEIELGQFREDLFYRLNVVSIRLPALRERREDIAPLVHFFLRKYQRRYRMEAAELPEHLLRAFESHPWPGNVRQLENLIRRWLILRDPQWLLEELQVGQGADGSMTGNLGTARATVAGEGEASLSLKDIGKRAARVAEKEAIAAMLQRTAWNKRKAAARLRISYKALLYKIREGGIVDPRAVTGF